MAIYKGYATFSPCVWRMKPPSTPDGLRYVEHISEFAMFCFGAVLGVIVVVSGGFSEMKKDILLIYID